MKKLVFRYLDRLFNNCIILMDEEEFKVINDEKNIICLVNTAIFFSYSEFDLMVTGFNLYEGEVVEYITDYLSENFPSLDLSFKPFWPHL